LHLTDGYVAIDAVGYVSISDLLPCGPASKRLLWDNDEPVDLRTHFETTAGALKRWLQAQIYDALAVALLWLVGLLALHVPGAPLWAFLAFFLQFIPHFGPVIALVGPAVAGGLSGGFYRLLFVLMLYAVVVVVDAAAFQPLIMKRTARVPFWATLAAPIVLGILFNFWGVLLAPPLLAVLFAYRDRRKKQPPDIEIIPPPARPAPPRTPKPSIDA
jgi:predicted PurR-regulated permease PerM